MLLKLENRYINISNITEYDPISGCISGIAGEAFRLTETQNTMLAWFLKTITGPTFGIFDVDATYAKREEIEARLERVKAAEVTEGLGELEAKLEATAQQFEKTTGKKLTAEQLDAARRKIQEAGLTKVIPINQRKN